MSEFQITEKMLKEFTEAKEAFILEELEPYYKDGNLCQNTNRD